MDAVVQENTNALNCKIQREPVHELTQKPTTVAF